MAIPSPAAADPPLLPVSREEHLPVFRPGSFRLLGFAPSSWNYAFRIWLAMVLALGTAFWLQLDNPFDAAATVAILSQNRRGQALAKAAYRLAGTAAGLVACIVLTDLFAQARDLFVLSFALWFGLCVFLGSAFEGPRAYGFVLAGYTVAIVVVGQIDQPTIVFNYGVSRAAVVTTAVVAVGLVNDLFGAPEVLPDARRQLHDAHDTFRDMVAAGTADPSAADTRRLLRLLTKARLDVQTLPSEGSAGSWQADAARSAMGAMASGLLALLVRAELRRCGAPAGYPFAGRAATALLLAEAELAAMRDHRPPSRRLALPIHTDRRTALRKAWRVTVSVLVGSALCILSGLPGSAQALTQVAILGCLGALGPDDRGFVKVCLLALPAAAVMALATEFLLLDGADDFPALALGLAPSVVFCCLLSQRPRTAEFGFLALIYVPVYVEPANRQDYDPLALIMLGLLFTAGALVLVGCTAVFPPANRSEQRRWIANRLRHDVRDAVSGRRMADAARADYLAIDRLARIDDLEEREGEAARRRFARHVRLCALAMLAVRARDLLRPLARERDTAAAVRQASTALAALSPDGLHAAGDALAGIPLSSPVAAAARAAADRLRTTSLLVAAQGRAFAAQQLAGRS
ncbi:MAG: FUSC family protein [Gluconacetobacter diazotrophicus]|nr:FUSC family protein [Gluconacetobacter diazotrophicus]